MLNTLRPIQLPARLHFGDEIQAQRRRKSTDGPQGRAEMPASAARRESGGGGGSSGGSGGAKLPPWMIVIAVIIMLIFGGVEGLSSLFGEESSDPAASQQQPADEPAAQVPADEPISAPVSGFTPQPAAADGSWTIMLYQDADDPILEQDIFTDLNEAERVGSTENVHIVAQLDRYKGAFKGDGNWNSARRYYITQDDDLNTIHSEMIADLGEVNMGDPATLIDFVTWAAQNYPADHYALILSDHGMGWPGGWTDPAPASQPTGGAPLVKIMGNALYLNQLDDALTEMRQQTGIQKFDIIGMDACLMGQLEVLSALEPHARYALTSQETEPALGWAYTAFLETLIQNPGMSAADLSKLVVQSYIVDDQRIVDDDARAEFVRQMGGTRASAAQVAKEIGKDVTLSAIDLSLVPDLMDSLNHLAYALQNEDQPTIASARTHALSFTNIFGKDAPPAYIDLGSFVQILKNESQNEDVQQLSGQVLAHIQQAVIAEKHGSAKKGATGVAIYYPNSSLYRSPYSGPQSYTLIAGRFARYSLWDDFLAFHYNDRSFESATLEAVVPPAELPSRAPGAGHVILSPLELSSESAAPGTPVSMSTQVTGYNIGNIYLFIGFLDPVSNAIFVADTDFLESPDTRQVDGVYYPRWSEKETFRVKFEWDPTVFSLSDGTNSSVALFQPQQYGATAEDAVYTVSGQYTFVDSGEKLNARLNFRAGQLVNILGLSGADEAGAPREIGAQPGDTFTILEKWLVLDDQGQVQKTEYRPGRTFVFGDQPLTWEENYAAQGNYVIGFIVTDLDGNSQEVYAQVTVQ